MISRNIAAACIALTAFLVAQPEPATAGTVTGTGTVQATVQAACELVAPPMINFGTVSSIGALAAEIDQTGTITLACSNGAPYTVYIGDGNNRVGVGTGNRQMANGTALLPYQLYKETGHINIWDATGGPTTTGGSGGVNGTGSGANQSLTVYGVIAVGSTIPSTTGSYTDSVVVTIAY